MKFLKSMFAGVLIAGVLLASASAQLAVTSTNAATSVGKNSLTMNGSITGTNGAASSGNFVLPGFVWGLADGGSLTAGWAHQTAVPTLGGFTNGASFSLIVGGLPSGTNVYWRAYAYQPDAGTNIVAVASTTASITTSATAAPALANPIASASITALTVTTGTLTTMKATTGTITTFNGVTMPSFAFQTNTFINGGGTTNTIISKNGIIISIQ